MIHNGKDTRNMAGIYKGELNDFDDLLKSMDTETQRLEGDIKEMLSEDLSTAEPEERSDILNIVDRYKKGIKVIEEAHRQLMAI